MTISDHVAQLDQRIAAVQEQRDRYVRELPRLAQENDRVIDNALDVLLDFDSTLSQLRASKTEILEIAWR